MGTTSSTGALLPILFAPWSGLEGGSAGILYANGSLALSVKNIVQRAGR